jgi:hypothetical protein
MIQQDLFESVDIAHLLAGFGAMGVAMQNYPAVVYFLKEMSSNFFPASKLLDNVINLIAFGAGVLCSGWVNFLINVDLLNKFFNGSDDTFALSDTQKKCYYAGIGIFVVTGILFGLMAFTFAMEGPFAALSILAGVFVAAIMTIQEVETWFSSFKPQQSLTTEQWLGQWIGHVIAIGNVIALSLLFTLSLAQSLMMINFTAANAFLIGALIAFSFGAFTEFYFYDYYLASFCGDFWNNWATMNNNPQKNLGLICVATNAFVNAALTYAGVSLLLNSLVLNQLVLLPTIALPIISSLSSFFAGSASFILGLDFWKGSNEERIMSQSMPNPTF